MFIYGIQSDVYADLGEAWLQDQIARLKQRQLQFGRHYRMNVDALLARSARAARAARVAAVATEDHDLAPDRIRRTTIDAIEHCSDRLAQMARPSLSAEPTIPTSEQPGEAESATLGEFSRVNGLDVNPHDEWMTVLADLTEVVVVDVRGKPSALGIAKAASIVQNRSYLEARARQLLRTLTKDKGDWRLIVIDFGVEALHQDCEFLMCFTFLAANCDLAATSPYAEIGFALLKQSHAAPIFVLTIRAANGFNSEPATFPRDFQPR